MRHGQFSTEYLLLLAFVLALLVPGVILFFSHSRASSSDIASAQLAALGREMVATADEVVSQGSGSWSTISIVLPDAVEDILINGSGTEIVIKYQSVAGDTEAVFYSDRLLCADTTRPLDGCADGSIFSSGAHQAHANFRFTSGGSKIGIKEVNETGGYNIFT